MFGIGRLLRALARGLSSLFGKASDAIEDNVGVMKQEYKEIIAEKAKAAQEMKKSVGALEGQRFEKEESATALEEELVGLREEMAGYEAMGQDRVEYLQSLGKTDEEIAADKDVLEYQGAYSDVSSTVAEKEKRIKELQDSAKVLENQINGFVLQLQTIAREVKTLESEQHEAVADVIASRNIADIYDAASGISTSGADDRLRKLRERRRQAKGQAVISSRVAGTDVSAMREKAKAAAKARASSSDFMAKIGIGKKTAAPAETKTSTPAKPKAELPEG